MLKKILHIVLVALLLVSTMGITISLHYCGGKLYDTGVFTEADNCCLPAEKGHEMEKANHCQANEHHKCGCENRTIFFRTVDDYTSIVFDLKDDGLPRIQLFELNSIISDRCSTSNVPKVDFPTLNISPPGIHTVLSLFQTYLI